MRRQRRPFQKNAFCVLSRTRKALVVKLRDWLVENANISWARQSHYQTNIPRLRVGNLSRGRLLADCSLISSCDRLLGLDPGQRPLGQKFVGANGRADVSNKIIMRR